MAKILSNFVCQQCGYVSPSYLGKCPNCGEWNTLVEQIEVKSQSSKIKSQSQKSKAPVRLIEVEAAATNRIPTGIAEMDRCLGGGVVPGAAILLAGEPGIGKSTLLLELASRWPGSVMYVAGEESAGQIKIRAQRLGIKAENVSLLEETDVDEIVGRLRDLSPLSLVIVDSIQTLTTGDLSGTAGSVGQVRESAGRLISLAKANRMPLFLVGHVTKEGAIAGPKILEHAVDTVLDMEGERTGNLRLLRAVKNRFGATDEVGVFEMKDTGLSPVTDLNGLVDIHGTEPGSCLTVALEGTRPMVLEVQGLSASTPLPSPRRVANGIDYPRLQMIVAVLQKRLNIPLYKEDIYVNVSGGIKIEEPAADLAVALAILSSFRGKPLPPKTVAFGELDLLGNVRRVNSLEKRLKEAKKLGFTNIVSPENLRSLPNFKF